MSAASVAPAKSQGLATASLILGILSILTSAAWLLGGALAITAIVLGAVSIGNQGGKKSLAGIITGGLGLVLSIAAIIIIQTALPALQKNQRDTQRKNDIVALAAEVMAYQILHNQQLPATSDLSNVSLAQVKSVASGGEPTTDTAVYIAGQNCSGVSSARTYKVVILLENGAEYCEDSY